MIIMYRGWREQRIAMTIYGVAPRFRIGTLVPDVDDPPPDGLDPEQQRGI
jgi:hypothetical protein